MKNDPITRNISEDLKQIYKKSKLYNYHRIFRKMDNQEEDSLTALEVLSLDLLQGMDKPTQTEFAKYIRVSKPNATYRINSLAAKGYIKKVQSEIDGRIFYLQVTDKTKELLGTGERYIDIISRRLKRNFSQEELKTFEKMMNSVANDFMIEMDRYLSLKRKDDL